MERLGLFHVVSAGFAWGFESPISPYMGHSRPVATGKGHHQLKDPVQFF